MEKNKYLRFFKYEINKIIENLPFYTIQRQSNCKKIKESFFTINIINFLYRYTKN